MKLQDNTKSTGKPVMTNPMAMNKREWKERVSKTLADRNQMTLTEIEKEGRKNE